MSPLIVGGRTLFGALSSQPTGITTSSGSEYYDTTQNKLYVYDGSAWGYVSTTAANFGGTEATHWWKNEGIYSSSTWTAARGNENFAASGTLTYTASDSRFNNLKSIGNTGNDYAYMSADSGTNGTFWNGGTDKFSFIMVIDKVQHNSGTSYGDGCFIQQRAGAADMSWSIDLVGDHTWGGSYGEKFGYIAPPGSYPQKGILLCRCGTSGADLKIEWWPAGGSTWSQRGSTQQGLPSGVNNSFDAINIFNFTSATGTTHRFSGAYAEIAYFKDVYISDTVRDAWKTYLVDKFNF